MRACPCCASRRTHPVCCTRGPGTASGLRVVEQRARVQSREPCHARPQAPPYRVRLHALHHGYDRPARPHNKRSALGIFSLCFAAQRRGGLDRAHAKLQSLRVAGIQRSQQGEMWRCPVGPAGYAGRASWARGSWSCCRTLNGHPPSRAWRAANLQRPADPLARPRGLSRARGPSAKDCRRRLALASSRARARAEERDGRTLLGIEARIPLEQRGPNRKARKTAAARLRNPQKHPQRVAVRSRALPHGPLPCSVTS